jgi:hypothetical protein
MAISTTGYKKTPSRCGGFLLSAQGGTLIRGGSWLEHAKTRVWKSRADDPMAAPLDMFNAAIMGLKRSCKRVPATSRL